MRPSLRTLAGLVLLLSACSGRSGTVTGDIVATGGADARPAAARAPVVAIPATPAFEQDWERHVTAVRENLAPAVARLRAAEEAAERARRAWDQALASRAGSGVGREQWNRSAAGRHWERELWAGVRSAAAGAAAARTRVRQVLAAETPRTEALLRQHAAQAVVADDRGHYVISGIRPGRVFLFCRVPAGERDLVWLRPLSVQAGVQRVDLSEANATGWTFES